MFTKGTPIYSMASESASPTSGMLTMNRPVPTRLKILRGNPGKRPINTAEPKPRIKMPPCPDHLNDDGKKEWRRVGRILVECGVLTDLDRAAISSYCTAWQRHVEAERE